MSVICILMLGCFFASSNGELADNWFFYDTFDFGMDFFHSLEYVNGNSPYKNFTNIYPPLANVFFAAVCKFIPKNIKTNWSDNFEGSLLLKGTEKDLRLFQSTEIAFLLYNIVIIIAFVYIFEAIQETENRTIRKWATICAIFSYGSLFAFERGNIVTLSFLLTVIFVNYRNNGSKIKRIVALLCLIIAAGIKLYPALFGLLLLSDRKRKSAILAIFLGVLVLLLPFFFFNEKLEGISIWVNAVTEFKAGSKPLWAGNSISSLLYNITRFIENRWDIIIQDSYFAIIGYAVAMISCICALLLNKDYQRTVAIYIAILSYSPQEDYVSIFGLIPLFSLFNEEKYIHKEVLIPFVILTVITLPLPVFYIKDLFYPRSVVVQVSIVVLFIWLFVKTVNTMTEKNRHKLINKSTCKNII